MTNPFAHMVAMLDERSTGHSQKSTLGLKSEFGTITKTGLKLDNFKHEITDFYVAEWLAKITLPEFSLIGTATSPVDDEGRPLPGSSTSPLTRYDFKKREIDKVKVEMIPDLKEGDRVLCVPVDDGDDVVVICKVVKR
ncbi:hypothetical protein P4V33_09190 [Brevibacillus borstelensis]|uniref:hypothetical protein n=1 Tax=Brevibacillus borstelensis TaxID=45462 RepID=UPI002E20D656|nr:hypothetical protein [Brevibacillus borstelensis]